MAGIRQATARVSAAKTRETVPQETLTTAFLQMKKRVTDRMGELLASGVPKQSWRRFVERKDVLDSKES
jgi:hypothetical protein